MGVCIEEEICLSFISFTFYCGFHHDLWVNTKSPWLPRKSRQFSLSPWHYCIPASVQSRGSEGCFYGVTTGGGEGRGLRGFSFLHLSCELFTQLYCSDTRGSHKNTDPWPGNRILLSCSGPGEVSFSGADAVILWGWSTEQALLMTWERI